MDIKFVESEYENYQLFVESFLMMQHGNYNSVDFAKGLIKRFNINSSLLPKQNPTDDGVAFLYILGYVMNDVINKDNQWRGEFDGDMYRRTIGLYSEFKLCKLFNKPFDMSGFDGGADISGENVRADIKTMIRNRSGRISYYANNLIWSQVIGVNYNCDIYIFTNVNKEKQLIEILGYAVKDSVIRGDIGVFRKTGSMLKNDKSEKEVEVDMAEIPYEQLIKPKNLQEWCDLLR